MNRNARVLSAAVALCGLCLVSGCVTNELVENRTVNEQRIKGWERSDRNPDVLEFVRFTKAQQAKAVGEDAPLAVRMSVSEATWNAHPIWYTISHLIDYGVLPIAGGLASYKGYQAMTGGGGNSSSTTVYADHGGQVNYNTGNGRPNQAGPATTTTTSTSSTGL